MHMSRRKSPGRYYPASPANGKKWLFDSTFRRFAIRLLLCIFTCFPLVSVAQINTDYTMYMGRNALFFEDYMLALQYFNRVIDTKPYLAQPYFFRGLTKLRLDDYYGAVADCSEAIERNPFITDSYQVRAIGYIELKEYQKAVADYLHVLSSNPRETNALHNISLCYMRLKEFAKAQENLDLLERYSSSGKSRVWIMKASCSIEQADTLKALEYLDKSLTYDTSNGDAYGFKASILMRQAKWPEAEQQFTKAIEVNQHNAELYVSRALARYYQWKLDAALADYDEAIRIQPGFFIARYNRGLLRMNVGDDNRAIEDFDFILNLQPDNDQALVNRGILRLQTGNYQGAIDDFTRVLKEHPNFLGGYQYRAEAYRKAGMNAQASRDEMLLLRANIDMRFGGNSWRAKGTPKPARKISDEDIENYNQVVESDPSEQAPSYQSPFRGKIQNKNTEQKPEPAFYLSYYKEYEELKQSSTFYKPLDEFNNRKLLPEKVLITNQENTLPEKQIARRFASIEALSERIEKGPNVSTLYLARALDYSMTQDMMAAVNDLQQAIRLDSTLVWSYFIRANVRWKLYQIQENATQESTSQKPLLPTLSAEKEKTGISRDASSEKVKETYAPGGNTQLELQSILRDLNKVIALAPDFAFAHYNRGLILAQSGRLDEAANAYTRALQLEPTLAEAYFNRGLVLIENNKVQEGVADLSRAGEMGIARAYNLLKRFSK